MSALRPLPPRPSLEFERKEAKALLRRLRAGDPDALARARARHPAIDASDTARIRLADAQLVIAREYGFTSWPRLVRYFHHVERQVQGHQRLDSGRRDDHDAEVRSFLAEHRRRGIWAARSLAAYVPRFYGIETEEVLASDIGEDEARLVVARRRGFPSWEVLLSTAEAEFQRQPSEWDVDPYKHVGQAIETRNLEELRRVVDAHPELLHPTPHEESMGRSPLRTALHHERRQGSAAMRPIIEWLESQGLDLQRELNRQLCGHMHMKTEKVRWLLDRGADPNWVAPNGVSVLEHALIRYWNGEAVELVAERAKPRDALWISAGLGDVAGVHRFLDARGKPTAAAHKHRPDFDLVGPTRMPQHPDPDDEEILMEAFLIAMLNGRTTVLEYMVSRGFPVNSLVYGAPIVHIAARNAMIPVLECLVRCGADLDLTGVEQPQSARELAREMFEQMPHDADRRRVVELCGMSPDTVLIERDARPLRTPVAEPRLKRAIDLACDDALRLGQAEVRRENLLFGLLRSGGLPLMFFTKVSRMDFERFRAEVMDRVRPTADATESCTLPMNLDAQAAIEAAIAIATERRRESVMGIHLLYALTRALNGAAAALLIRYGGDVTLLSTELERAM